MKFNDEHKVIIETLDEAEARAFVKFLSSEILRHKEDIAQAEALILFVEEELKNWD